MCVLLGLDERLGREDKLYIQSTIPHIHFCKEGTMYVHIHEMLYNITNKCCFWHVSKTQRLKIWTLHMHKNKNEGFHLSGPSWLNLHRLWGCCYWLHHFSFLHFFSNLVVLKCHKSTLNSYYMCDFLTTWLPLWFQNHQKWGKNSRRGWIGQAKPTNFHSPNAKIHISCLYKIHLATYIKNNEWLSCKGYAVKGKRLLHSSAILTLPMNIRNLWYKYEHWVIYIKHVFT